MIEPERQKAGWKGCLWGNSHKGAWEEREGGLFRVQGHGGRKGHVMKKTGKGEKTEGMSVAASVGQLVDGVDGK